MPKIKYIFKGQKMIWPVLPSEYQRVEWIESSGTQYINTGYKPNTNTEIETDLSWGSSQVEWAVFYGVTSADKSIDGLLGRLYYSTSTGNTRTFNWWFFNETYGEAQYATTNDVFHHIISKKNYCSLDGNVKTITTTGTPYNGSIYLFCGNNGGSARRYSKCKMKEFIISESGIKKMHFVPCYKISDHTIGMYDLVGGVFYTNNGSGSFNKGPDTVALPSTYQRVEYIQSSASSQGATSSSGQYIDTGFTPTSNTKIYTDFAYTSTTVQGRMYGIQTESSSYMTFDTYINGSGYYARAMIDGSGNRVATTVSADSSRHEFILDKSGYKIYTNGSQVYSAGNDATPTKSCNHTLPLFARWLSVESSTTYNKICQHSSAKLYSCRIWDNGTLVRHFIPCYRKSDNVIGLYDIVGGTFYTNKGSGSFTKGGNI